MAATPRIAYNIFSKLESEIADFEQNGVFLIGKPSARDSYGDKNNRGRDGGYYYSQRNTLEAIDLACASKYRRGLYDSEGKRKTFINIVNFHADVALNQTAVNVSNYILEPTDDDYTWPVFFMDKQFKEWTDEESYDDIIDELADDFVRKGTCVVKTIKGSVERVPLRTLRNSQTAKSLSSAAKNGGYVILENEMSYNEMKIYPKWKLDDLDTKKIYTVFERYTLIPRAILNEFKNLTVTDKEWEEYILAVQILIPHEKAVKKDSTTMTGRIAYIEEIDEIPLEEAHYQKEDGRWLGRGEVEKQLENQISRNITANLRKRALLWATRKLYQSTDDEVARNLLMKAQDGEVIKIGPNGQITQVNTQSQHLGDFQTDENSVKENSQQISFSFEAASGESMPSGTPYRLGVILEGAVSKYFKRKQDTFSNFLKRSFFNQLIPIFKKQMKTEHTIRYATSDDNYEQVLKAMIIVKTNEVIRTEWKKKHLISYEQARAIVEKKLAAHPYLFAEAPNDLYDKAQCYMRLNINEPIAADIETLTTLYSDLSQKGDPRAERILRMMLSKKGKNLDYLLGPAAKAPAAPNPAMPSPLPPGSLPAPAETA